jgi:hypothetical protein
MNASQSTLLNRARTWAEIASHAPSGDNSQPWLVSLAVTGDQVVLSLNLDEATKAAPSVFDCAYSASYLSLGAFARNFCLLADSEGHSLADLAEHNGRFTLTLSPSAEPTGKSTPTGTAALIRRRATNRLPFKKDPLDADTVSALTRLAAGDGLVLRFFGGSERNRIAAIFSGLDQIRYRNARLYLEFLDKLRFGAEAERSRDGLRDTTLGVPGPSLVLLRLLRTLRKVRFVRSVFFLGFEKIMAFFGCVLLIRNSGAVGVLSGGEDTPLGWFRLGFAFESLWLETTQRNLALQPLGTTLLVYRMQREARRGETSPFSAAELDRLSEYGRRFRTDFELEFERPAIAFRVGYGPAVKSTSLRRTTNSVN